MILNDIICSNELAPFDEGFFEYILICKGQNLVLSFLRKLLDVYFHNLFLFVSEKRCFGTKTRLNPVWVTREAQHLNKILRNEFLLICFLWNFLDFHIFRI
jgi:hypothetical protein